MYTKPLVWFALATALLTVLASGALSVSPTAQAAAITVTSTSGAASPRRGNGTIPPVGGCTLRDAIRAANTDTAIGGCPAGNGPDVIVLAPSTVYTLSVVDNTDPSLGPNGLPVITSDITIDGQGATILRNTAGGTPEFRLFQVNDGGVLRLHNVTLSNGKVSGGFLGGAIYNHGGGVLTLTDSTLSGNSAENNGGGVFNNQAAMLTVIGSTVAGNSALNGGGVYNWGAVTVVNSTFTGNSASFGGGLNNGSGATTIFNSTLAENSATTSGGNIFNASSGTVTVHNTIIANSLAGGNCGGSIADGGVNLRWPASDASCVGAAGDPKLGPLADNGGPTQTMALQPGSAALEKGKTATCLNAPVNGQDQRGVSRPQPDNTRCDIGAFESGLRPAPTITKKFDPLMVLVGQPSTLTFQITNPNRAGFGFTGIGFNDALPNNLVVANPPNVNNDCGGIVSAAAGDGAVSLKGGILLLGASCTVQVDVASQVIDVYTNTTGPVSSTESGPGDPSNPATLRVVSEIHRAYMPDIFK